MFSALSPAPSVISNGELTSERMKRRWAFYEARHPWRASAANVAAVTFPMAVVAWVSLGWIGATVIGVVAAVGVIVSGIAWGPEGPLRLRFVRRYGALPEWPEARWMPEHSTWPN